MIDSVDRLAFNQWSCHPRVPPRRPEVMTAEHRGPFRPPSPPQPARRSARGRIWARAPIHGKPRTQTPDRREALTEDQCAIREACWSTPPRLGILSSVLGPEPGRPPDRTAGLAPDSVTIIAVMATYGYLPSAGCGTVVSVQPTTAVFQGDPEGEPAPPSSSSAHATRPKSPPRCRYLPPGTPLPLARRSGPTREHPCPQC